MPARCRVSCRENTEPECDKGNNAGAKPTLTDVPVIHDPPRALALMVPAGDFMPPHPKSQDEDVVPCISLNRITDFCTVCLGTGSLSHMLFYIVMRSWYESSTVQNLAEISRYARQHPCTPGLHAHQH